VNFNISLTPVKVDFNKYEGTGNDFVIIDNRSLSFPSGREIIAGICHRRFGIGADGLILIEPSDEADFTMRYFNSDGNESTMCGNGGRCTAHFAMKHGIAKASMRFMAADGIHHALVSDSVVNLSMSDVTGITGSGDTLFLNTGSPHLVMFVDDTGAVDVKSEGRRIRYSEQYAPDGTNVNFVSLREGKIVVRTYERGVEDETLSCGTGVTASAIASVVSGHFDSNHVMVETRGGILSVSFRRDGPTAREIMLTGPATFVFSGEIEL
jgi:diaminopimelate epimerase